MNKIKNILLGLITPVLILLLWWYVTSFTDTPSTILPAIPDTWSKFVELIGNGKIGEDLKISLVRVFEGYLTSVIIGVVLGTILGMSTLARKILGPTFTTIRQIPIMAWIPLLILWFGIGESSKIVIIVIASVFPIMLNTQAGIASTPKEFGEVAKLYKLSKIQTFLRVYLPHALPQIQTGLKLGLGVSWMAVVAAELIAATSGIGYTMSYARTAMQSNVVIICMLVIGLVGILMDKIITVIFSILTPWERVKKDK